MPLQITAPTLASQAKAPTNNQDMGSKDVFLKMLVAQMQNQDPLNPADSTQMASQLAQFNMVEQQIDTNKYLAQLAGAQGGTANNLDMASAGYLGRTVMLNQSDIQFDGSNQSLMATLDSDAENIYVAISDDYGTPVRTMSLSSMPAGDLNLSWDGQDDAGNAVNIGTYHIDIAAFDTNGIAVNVVPQRLGVVDAVRMTPSGIALIVDGVATSLSNVTEVRL